MVFPLGWVATGMLAQVRLARDLHGPVLALDGPEHRRHQGKVGSSCCMLGGFRAKLREAQPYNVTGPTPSVLSPLLQQLKP